MLAVIRALSFRSVAGVLTGFAGALLLGEMVTRICPPEDLKPFLGEASPLSGVYRSDAELGVDYRTPADFRAQYNDRLQELEGSPRRRSWLWFGNSFVQAPGMLGDLAQSDLPEVRMFYLRRNVPLPVQVAQLRLLLESGLKPERIIIALVPLDVVALAKQPLSTIAANQRGAIVYGWRAAPGLLEPVLHHSRLALLGWIRSGQYSINPSFQARLVTEQLPPSARQDLQTLFRIIGHLGHEHSVAITVLLLPNREQIFGKAGHALQDFEAESCRSNGIDCFDAGALFIGEKDKLSLFLPDWHFTAKANHIILQALYQHWREQNDGKERQ